MQCTVQFVGPYDIPVLCCCNVGCRSSLNVVACLPFGHSPTSNRVALILPAVSIIRRTTSKQRVNGSLAASRMRYAHFESKTTQTRVAVNYRVTRSFTTSYCTSPVLGRTNLTSRHFTTLISEKPAMETKSTNMQMIL